MYHTRMEIPVGTQVVVRRRLLPEDHLLRVGYDLSKAPFARGEIAEDIGDEYIFLLRTATGRLDSYVVPKYATYYEKRRGNPRVGRYRD